jgi:hypothetical protein
VQLGRRGTNGALLYIRVYNVQFDGVTGTPYAVITALENNPSKTEVAVSDTESLVKLCRLSNPHLHQIAVGQGDGYRLDIGKGFS